MFRCPPLSIWSAYLLAASAFVHWRIFQQWLSFFFWVVSLPHPPTHPPNCLLGCEIFLKRHSLRWKIEPPRSFIDYIANGSKMELNMELKHFQMGEVLECCTKQKIGTREINPSGWFQSLPEEKNCRHVKSWIQINFPNGELDCLCVCSSLKLEFQACWGGRLVVVGFGSWKWSTQQIVFSCLSFYFT